MKKLFPGIFLLLLCVVSSHAQLFLQPNIGLKSHETMELIQIELTAQKTVVSLSIENRIEGGNFCADKNIYIIDSEGRKLKLKKSSGIPVCPESYKFKSIGEILLFKLEFPALKSSVKWIDIIEDCSENCFSLYGVTLNNLLNKKYNEAFSFAEKRDVKKAIELYINILDTLPVADQGIKGALYATIISLWNESGDKSLRDEWVQKMVNSNAPRLELYIKNLKGRGIINK